MPTPEWAENLTWVCADCGSTYPSRWARDICTMEDREADRDARRGVKHG